MNDRWSKKFRATTAREVQVKRRPHAYGGVYEVDFRIVREGYGGGEVKEDEEAHGTIKWDGCADWSNSNNVMLHLCGPADIHDLATAIRAAYALAHPLFTNSCGPSYEQPAEYVGLTPEFE